MSIDVARSAPTRHEGAGTLPPDYHEWMAACAARAVTEVQPIALEELSGWHRDDLTGNIVHDSGRFFSVEGVQIERPGSAVPQWSQPIIHQPETGVLGILVTEIDGIPHFLMQAKVEPGNCNGIQLSPTVQATRSNYTGAHHGRAVPYVDYFREAARHTVLTDVRQSEQGAWFYHKRNRSVILRVTEPVEALDDFRWLTLGQIHELLSRDDIVNMDSRAVLACLPFTGPARAATDRRPDDFQAALALSCSAGTARHHLPEIMSWLTELRSTLDMRVRLIPLNKVTQWQREDGRLRHPSGRFFEVTAVRVRAQNREVGQWAQPIIAARGLGVAAFLVRRIRGVLHVLVQGKPEPGHLDLVEMAPTVQCTPENYEVLPDEARPPYLDEVLSARPEQLRFDTVLSEEGGRFYHTRTRYQIVEVDPDWADERPSFRWMTVHQLTSLLRHSYYLNMQARTLIACLHSLC